MIIEEPGYTPVECDPPIPCPFCDATPRLAQLAHVTRYERVGRSRKTREVKITIIASSRILTADTFWFVCDACGCTSGGHHATAQAAAEAWNRRAYRVFARLVRRIVGGQATENDRAMLTGLADQVEGGTLDPDLVALARQLRFMARRKEVA